MQNNNTRLGRLEKLLYKGEYFLAYDFIHQPKKPLDASLQFNQMAVRAMIGVGAYQEAMALLESLKHDNRNQTLHDHEETLGLIGRIYKDAYKITGKESYARRSQEAYAEAYTKTRGSWSAINTATMSWIIGKVEYAKELAEELISNLSDQIQEEDSYWKYATKGEALLLLQQNDAAVNAYRKAKVALGNRREYLVSSIRQINLLRINGFEVPEPVLDCLQPPAVLTFSGHMD